MPQPPNVKRLVENKEPESDLNQRIAERVRELRAAQGLSSTRSPAKAVLAGP